MNHCSSVLIVRTPDGEWVKGDPFWPQTTTRITEAARLSTMADAKKFVKTATKRLKAGELKIVKASAEYDSNFTCIAVRVIMSEPVQA